MPFKFHFHNMNGRKAGGKKVSAFFLINTFLLIVAVVALGDAWGGHVLSYLGAALIAHLLPLMMVPLGIWAVITAWDWPWYWAVLVFMWPLVLIAFGAGSLLLFSKFLRSKLKKGQARQSQQKADDSYADIEVEAESSEIHDMPDDKK